MTLISRQILVDTPESVGREHVTLPKANDLTGWLISRARAWEIERNQKYSKRWAEYWRMWRAFWAAQDKNKQSERSRLVGTAIMQAVDMTVSEIEEAMFSRARWIDAQDDEEDDQADDIYQAITNLLEDFDEANIKDAVAESVLNAAVIGTGILKMDVRVVPEMKTIRVKGKLRRSNKETVLVTLEAIRADHFIPDPAGRTIDEMLGCFHKIQKPLHAVLERIEDGTYLRSALSQLQSPRQSTDGANMDADEPGITAFSAMTDVVLIHEYHGKVPAKFLMQLEETKSLADEVLLQDIAERPDDGDGPLVEAIVTIANESVILRAMANPFVMKDRSIIAYQFEKIPGQFWGRGVAEKGANPQKALSAELRARQDALGFISAPMMGVDVGRMPKGFKLEVRPGKVWATQGNPSEILQPLKIGEINAATFNQTAEMERMVQMATGAFDTASALGRAQTSSGGNALNAGSLFMGAFVKRSKRAIHNIDRNCLTPLVRKAIWRYMEFAPRRYPNDFKFQVKTTLGIVAREVEQLNLTQVMAMLPQEFPAVNITVAKGIIELANVHNKSEIVQSMADALKPNPEAEARKAELARLDMEKVREEVNQIVLENGKLMAETREVLSQVMVNLRRAEIEDDKVEIEQDKVLISAEEVENFKEQNRIARERLDLQERALSAKIKKEASSSD